MVNINRYNKAFAIVPSDTVNFTPTGKGAAGEAALIDAIYVGGAGDVVAVLQDGTAITFKAPPVGTILPIACKRVNSTNTTATLLIALCQI